MRRSNRNFNKPNPPGNPRAFDYLGEWGSRPLPAWGGENRTGNVRFQFFFSGAEVANSYKHVFRQDGRVWRKRSSICQVFERSLLKTPGADDNCFLIGMTDKSSDRVGHLNTILARGGGNLNDPIFKSSNAREGGILKFSVDRRIIWTKSMFPSIITN